MAGAWALLYGALGGLQCQEKISVPAGAAAATGLARSAAAWRRHRAAWWALSLPDKELCLREALAVCTPPAPEPSVKCCCYVASVVSDSVQPQRRQPTRLPRGVRPRLEGKPRCLHAARCLLQAAALRANPVAAAAPAGTEIFS